MHVLCKHYFEVDSQQDSQLKFSQNCINNALLD